jgi:ubiquinone/menaquinone biosynthesis C-methylase UbiE
MIQDNLFFEGKDFPGRPFKALMPQFYPEEYQEYIRLETELIKEKVAGKQNLLEGGIGIGRLTPIISPIVGKMTGVDKAELMIEQAKQIALGYANVQVVKGDLEKLTELFPKKIFDVCVCAWNTLGNVQDEVKVLSQFREVTNGPIFITVFLKGTLEQRKNWYKTVGIVLDQIDETSQTVYTKTGLTSKAYSLEEIAELAKEVDLKIKDSKILNNLVLWVELGE